ncbi:MAG: hypothetical protein GC205_12090 [Bacteroidetes bacterium]|nr:hypothetical protein [Bacteroidota bacterium]
MKLLKSANYLFTSVLVLTLINTSVSSQTYTIPFAEKQPAWVFPLWFTNGDGQKDTIYLAYDPEASEFLIDTVFGEFAIEPNGSDFEVRIGPDWKVYAADQLVLGGDLIVYNYIEPFGITYDARMFYSDSLPGLPSNLVPKVWASFEGSGFIEGCPIIDAGGFIVILSDTTIDGYPGSSIDDDFCMRDSMIFVENLTGPSIIALAPFNQPTGVVSGGDQIGEFADAWFVQDQFHVSVNSTVLFHMYIYDLAGSLIYERMFEPGIYQYKENLSVFQRNPNSLLLFYFLSESNSFSKKILQP